MSHSQMYRLFAILTLVLPFATLAHGDSAMLEGRPNAASYLFFYDRLHNFRNLSIAARGLAEAAEAQAAFDLSRAERLRRVYTQMAVSEEDLRIAELQSRASSLSVKRYRHDEAAANAQVEANRSLLPTLQGGSVPLSEVYGNPYITA